MLFPSKLQLITHHLALITHLTLITFPSASLAESSSPPELHLALNLPGSITEFAVAEAEDATVAPSWSLAAAAYLHLHLAVIRSSRSLLLEFAPD